MAGKLLPKFCLGDIAIVEAGACKNQKTDRNACAGRLVLVTKNNPVANDDEKIIAFTVSGKFVGEDIECQAKGACIIDERGMVLINGCQYMQTLVEAIGTEAPFFCAKKSDFIKVKTVSECVAKTCYWRRRESGVVEPHKLNDKSFYTR